MEISAGLRKLGGLAKDLEDGSGIVAAVLPAAMVAARRYAATHPTPQSRIAAGGLVARGDSMTVPPSAGLAYELAASSEYGSSIYAPFGPRRGSPAWFGRVAVGEDKSIVAAGDKALETVMDKAL